MHRKRLQSPVCRNWCQLFHFKFPNQRKSTSSCFQSSRAGSGIHRFCRRRTKILLGNRTRQLFLRCSGLLPATLVVRTPARIQRLLSVIAWPRCPLWLVYAKWRWKLITSLKAQELGVLVRSPSRGEGVSLEHPRVWKTSHGASQKSSLSPPDTTSQVRAKFHRATAWMQQAWGTAGPWSEVPSMREKTEGGAQERTCVGRQRQ